MIAIDTVLRSGSDECIVRIEDWVVDNALLRAQQTTEGQMDERQHRKNCQAQLLRLQSVIKPI